MELTRARKNVKNACVQCRERKRKCDGAKPTCFRCAVRKKICVYDPTPSKARKRRIHDDSQVEALKDHIAILKSYTERLEYEPGAGTQNELEDNSLDHEAQLWTEADSDPGGLEPCGRAGDTITTPPKSIDDLHGRLPHAVNELSRLLWTTHIGKEGETSFQGPSGNFSFQQPSDDRGSVNTGVNEYTDADPMAQYHIHNAEIKRDLANAFMKYINEYHLFVEMTFDLTSLFDPQNPLPLQFLHAAMLAAGSCYAKDASSATAGRAFTAFAESIALECCREYPSTQVVSGLAILSWIKLSQEENHMGWVYNAMAASLVVHLGLHFPLPVSTQAMRKLAEANDNRNFWSVCLMDRIATMMLGRNCAIPWRRIKTPFPQLPRQDREREAEMTFALRCQLYFLFDKYMDQIYAFDFDEKDSNHQLQLLISAREALLKFRDEMSAQCPIQFSDSLPHTCFLYTSYYTSMMLIHRPFLGTSHTDSVRRVAYRATTTAAIACTKVLRNMLRTSNLANLPFYLVHHVLTTAICHLINATSSDNRLQRTSSNGLKSCLEVLECMKGTWHARASQAVTAIQEIANRWHVVAALPINFSEPLPRRGTWTDELMRSRDEPDLQFLEAFENMDDFVLPSSALSGGAPILELSGCPLETSD